MTTGQQALPTIQLFVSPVLPTQEVRFDASKGIWNMFTSSSGGVSHHVTVHHLFPCFNAYVVAPQLSLDDTFCHPLLWAITTLIHPAPPLCPISLTHTHSYIMVLVNTQRTSRVCLTALWQDAAVWHLAALLPHNYDLPRTHVSFPHLPHRARLYCPYSIKEAAGCISTGGTVWPGIYPIVPYICGCPEWKMAI